MSIASLLLAAGAKGKRMALPNTRILIHQLSGGFEGQGTDIEIQAREVIGLKRRLEEIYSKHTGKTVEEVSHDMERDFFLDPEEAKGYGIIDTVISRRDAQPGVPPHKPAAVEADRGLSTSIGPRGLLGEALRPQAASTTQGIRIARNRKTRRRRGRRPPSMNRGRG